MHASNVRSAATIYRLALCKVSIVLAGQQLVPISSDDTLDISTQNLSICIPERLREPVCRIIPVVHVVEQALHLVDMVPLEVNLRLIEPQLMTTSP